ncbi:hypothetical protein FPQ18DRAFT_309990 [Pyronema domesticum]|uniref:Uncharacterized protein n=1 Tax=Pyronema omphalodes (strain CBS 100304) TaxID=1076935 RepID=U4L7X6_PYROM|nr:hypothetical protein FPQ18DRAFT_309990 [Pyronema domesticum]CCX06239.1 Protein of unknown function [Pyronema omphalodes CBS 100304]
MPAPRSRRSSRDFSKNLNDHENYSQQANHRPPTAVSRARTPTNPPKNRQYQPPASYGQYLGPGGMSIPTNLHDQYPVARTCTLTNTLDNRQFQIPTNSVRYVEAGGIRGPTDLHDPNQVYLARTPTNPPGSLQYQLSLNYVQYLEAQGIRAPTSLCDPTPEGYYVYYADPEDH